MFPDAYMTRWFVRRAASLFPQDAVKGGAPSVQAGRIGRAHQGKVQYPNPNPNTNANPNDVLVPLARRIRYAILLPRIQPAHQ